MKNAVVETHVLSKTFNAPLDFSYAWCTDFREDDWKMTGSKVRRKFLERTDRKVIWTVAYKEDGRMMDGIRVVWLNPPNSWHLATCGDHVEVGDYKLTAVSKNKTHLDMTFHVTYDDPAEAEPQESWEKDAMKNWDAYAKYQERDLRASISKKKS